MPASPTALSLHQVSKHFHTPQGRLTVLDKVDLTLMQGSSLALMGESGSGKSTLLHLVAGLDLANQGQIKINNQSMQALNETQKALLRRHELGLVFQQFNLISSLKVADNLAFQARLAGCYDPLWQTELAARLGLTDLLQRYPEQLSGGQQQRVAIGRALGHRPSLLLADEPTGSLDETTSDQVMALLLELVRLSGCGLLMVTHSKRIALQLDHTLRLHAGQLTADSL